MSHWESTGKSSEWYTPAWIFDALGCDFSMDVAAPPNGKGTHVPARRFIYDSGVECGLTAPWVGFVWMNPPYGGRNGIEPWLSRFFRHGNGIALTPDRTSAPWFQTWAPHATSILFLPKVKFERPDGTIGRSPSNGTALMASGAKGHGALMLARHLGFLCAPRLVARDDVQEAA